MISRSMTIRGVLAGAALAAGAFGIASPARAADDGYQNVFSSVLTAVGVLTTDKAPDIEYRERPPLVLPPKMELAKPVKGAAHPASWPKDPDVLKARKANETARAPEEDRFTNSAGGVLSKDELAQGRAQQEDAGLNTGMCGGFGHSDATCRVSPDELKREGDHYAAENPTAKAEITAGVEPDRLYLTQPPKGYLKATKTVKATREGPEIKVDDSNPKTELLYKAKPDEQ